MTYIKVKPVKWDYPLTRWFNKNVLPQKETSLSLKEISIRGIRKKFNLTRKEAELCYEYSDIVVGKATNEVLH